MTRLLIACTIIILTNKYGFIYQQVIWFSASQHLSDNNKYGNVSHTICIESIMERFGVHLYFIDQTITPSHTFTRVLLTPNSHENDLNNVGFNDYGTPLKLNPANQLWYHTTQCQNSRTLETHKHELEVAIEVNLNDLSWVYNNCVIRPNNHSKANSEIYTKDFGANHCNHYNYYGNICPSPFDEAKTRQILQEKCHKIIQTEAKLDAELKKEKRKSK